MIEKTAIAKMPPMSEAEREIAAFRARDALWTAIGELFDRYQEEEGLSYAALGRRIGKSRGQVQRWLSAPVNLTMESAGLLAEGLDADLRVLLQPHLPEAFGTNYAHPCVEAADMLNWTIELSSNGEVRGSAIETEATNPAPAVRDYTLQFDPK